MNINGNNTCVNVVLIGGSGFWSETNYIKSLLELISELEVKVTAIVDPISPKIRTRHINLQKLVELQNPKWVNPLNFSSVDSCIKSVSESANLVIISSNPETHFEYALASMKLGLNVILDKPLVVEKSASSNILSAEAIIYKYNILKAEYLEQLIVNPNYKCVSILRRRSLDAFTDVEKSIVELSNKHRVGIDHLSILVNGGIHKFPEEILNGKGAHDYYSGIGSLSHSAYHYIDILTWFLLSAKGSACFVKPKLNYVRRVADYVDTGGYVAISKVVDGKRMLNDSVSLSEASRAAELDVSFTLELMDKDERKVGNVLFTYNHTTFSPRTHPINLVSDHANFRDGGRMSSFIIDIQQGGLQALRITKNDKVFSGNTIFVDNSTHPRVSSRPIKEIYHDAYDLNSISMKSLLKNIIESIVEDSKLVSPFISALTSEELNMSIYAEFYRLISSEYCQKEITPKLIRLNSGVHFDI